MSATFNSVDSSVGLVEPVAIAPAASPEPAAPDFIRLYADFADVFEMPRQLHEWVGAQLIASVLNGRVRIPWGPVTYPLDLWVLLLSESGQGRNTATDMALEVIKAANLQGLLHKATWGSKSAFFQQIAQNPTGLYVWPELSVVLQTLNDPKFAGVKEWITDRYDNPREPDSITYRQTGKKSDTPPIVFDEVPRMNILATSSVDWFINNLEQPDITGGFIPRWLPKRVEKSNRVLAKPLTPNRELLPALGQQLASIAKLRGDADLSQVEGLYEEWYRDARARFEGQPNSALSVPFFSRLRAEVLKLAVIFEISQSGTLKVTEQALQRAIEVVSDAEETIFEFLPCGMSREGSEVEKMAERIRVAGPEGITQSDLTRAFQHWTQWERSGRMQTLLQSERVRPFTQQTKGRTGTRYVHQDHYADSQTSHLVQSS